MSDQPEALRLADALCDQDPYEARDLAAAAELRRQHSEIEALKAERDKLVSTADHALEFWKALAAELPNRRAQIEALTTERDALKVALEMLLGYEPNCCVCGDEACDKPTEVWAMARAALKTRSKA